MTLHAKAIDLDFILRVTEAIEFKQGHELIYIFKKITAMWKTDYRDRHQ